MAETIMGNRRSNVVDTMESDLTSFHPLLSWRSMLGGLLVSFLALAILLSLGMAFGGIGLNQGPDANSAGIFTGVWFLVSSIVALFIGGYFAARISKFHTARVGGAQGLVIAAFFFGFVLMQTFSAIGWIGSAAGKVAGGTALAISAGAAQASQSQTVSDTANTIAEDALGDLNLSSEPHVVIQGVATRLLRGNTDQAKLYLARQAGITPEEADRRIADLRARYDAAIVQARETAAHTMQAMGWSLFAILLLGSAAALSGGAVGSRANIRRPLMRTQDETIRDFSAAPI